MKEIVISTARQKREALILLACFLGAVILNIMGIIMYHTAWKELYTQWFPLLILTVVLYLLVLFVRVLVAFTIRLFRQKKAG